MIKRLDYYLMIRKEFNDLITIFIHLILTIFISVI